jgi:ribosomal protein L37E
MSAPTPPTPPADPAGKGSPSSIAPGKTSTNDEKVLCERCGAEMYRMHAVWRCSACGYKTDCCGW